MEIHRFFVTFGQRSPFSNGFVEILVQNEPDVEEAENKARKEAFEVFGDHWSMIYTADKFVTNRGMFRDGKLGRTIKL